jgi:hypothetical protein
MLTQLLRHGSLTYQDEFCDLDTGQLVPLPLRTVTAAIQQSGLRR